jgi:nicotinamidase-related amidase
MRLPAPALRPEETLILIVDIQERLVPAIHEVSACLDAVRRLVGAARVLGVPMLATEQYPAGLGPTLASLREQIADVPMVEKTRFSACVQEVLERLAGASARAIIVVGIEAHVCVQQTVLDLLRLGYTPYLCVDAIGSRRPLDRDTAIERMRDAGAIVTTTESVIFELTGEAGTDTFKKVLKIVK